MSQEGKKQTILVVDDTTENIDVLNGILSADYKIKVALNGEKALKIAGTKESPDLILLDIMMPGMDGYEVCRRLKKDRSTKNIPVIFVTAKGEVDDETKGFELGAVDYITKPVSPPIVQARVKAQLELKEARLHAEQLLSKTLLGSIKLLTDILTLVSPQTFSQSSRLKRSAHDIAISLNLPDVWLIEIAALLSQIGCVTIPKEIIKKMTTGEHLTSRERVLYSSHPAIGYDLIKNIPRLETIAEMISHQHDTLSHIIMNKKTQEWDTGLLGGQILKIAFDFDQLIIKGKTPKMAIIELRNRGGIYPPFLMDALSQNQSVEKVDLKEMSIKLEDMRSNMLLLEDVITDDGTVIIGQGNEISDSILSLLKRYAKHRDVKEPIRVQVLEPIV